MAEELQGSISLERFAQAAAREPNRFKRAGIFLSIEIVEGFEVAKMVMERSVDIALKENVDG